MVALHAALEHVRTLQRHQVGREHLVIHGATVLGHEGLSLGKHLGRQVDACEVPRHEGAQVRPCEPGAAARVEGRCKGCAAAHRAHVRRHCLTKQPRHNISKRSESLVEGV